VVLSVGSWHPNLPSLGTLVLDPHLLLLHHDTFQQMATPSTTTMSGQLTQECRRTTQSPLQPFPLLQHPSNLP
jgi:hypothetical protein